MTVNECPFADIEAAATALAADLATTLRTAIDARGSAVLAVSGGRTPAHVFQRLRDEPLDWGRVTVTLIDERWAPPTHVDSNEKLVRDYLLQGPAAKAACVPLYGGEASPMEGQPACEARLAKLAQIDAAYLGMGPDGHFASLFPGDAALDVRDGCCVAVPETPQRVARMSLTAPLICAARHLCLLYAGDDKHEVYQQARQPGDYHELPLRLLFDHAQGPVEVLRVA